MEEAKLDLLSKQRELMEKVPHTVRPDALMKMCVGAKVIDALLRFLNSTGHKPWRPVPLPPMVQQGLLKELKDKVNLLAYVHRTTMGADKDFGGSELYSRQIVSVFGVIEEAIEYLNSLTDGSDRAHRLEECTDVQFFFMELMLLDGFTWDDVESEYQRKWKVNMKRYEDGAKGDYSWDDRGKKESL